jgi:hypothetical protein
VEHPGTQTRTGRSGSSDAGLRDTSAGITTRSSTWNASGSRKKAVTPIDRSWMRPKILDVVGQAAQAAESHTPPHPTPEHAAAVSPEVSFHLCAQQLQHSGEVLVG